jgi:predicted protein tyrosine phosphatase
LCYIDAKGILAEKRAMELMKKPICVVFAAVEKVHPTKLLFVCSQNRIRSLTAEKVFESLSGHEVRSAGTQDAARVRVTEGHIGWADIIFVMEKSHLNKLRAKFPEALAGKQVVTLHIPDEYNFMQAELVDELKAKVGEYMDFGSSC